MLKSVLPLPRILICPHGASEGKEICSDTKNFLAARSMTTIDKIIRELPPHLRQEVEDYALFLLSRERKKTGVILKQDWAGGLAALKGSYTSVELQKKALEWRSD